MSKPLRYALLAAGTLVTLVVVGVVALLVASNRSLARTFAVPAEAFAAPMDSAAIAEGGRLALFYGCADCHAGDLGGRALIESAAFGTVGTPNLTRGAGGLGGAYTDAAFERAIRHGVRPDGRSLVIMPASSYQHLSDEDVGRIVAYVRSVPSVDREPPALRPGPIMRMLLATQANMVLEAARVTQTAEHPASVPAGPTADYGRYLAQACKGCHAPDFAGGPTGEPGAPLASNLTPDSATGLGTWTRGDFTRALREGRRPDGRELSPAMPWSAIGHATDDEITALWTYLRTLPAVNKPREN